jgi:hypothetical protein
LIKLNRGDLLCQYDIDAIVNTVTGLPELRSPQVWAGAEGSALSSVRRRRAQDSHRAAISSVTRVPPLRLAASQWRVW